MKKGVKKTLKVAVYGGAFDPPHIGHADAIRQASFHADEVIVVPSYRHAFGKKMTNFDVRIKLIEMMLSSMQDVSGVKISDIERSISLDKRSCVYSLELMRALSQSLGVDGSEMGFVIGQDNVKNLHMFHGFTELLTEFRLLVVKENQSIHSSDIRTRIKEGIEVSDFLPDPSSSSLINLIYGNTQDYNNAF